MSRAMTKQSRNLYVPEPVDMDAVARAIAQSISSIDSSYALLARISAYSASPILGWDATAERSAGFGK
jgi:hypothetical protein